MGNWGRAVPLAFLSLVLAGAAFGAEFLECKFPIKAANGGWIPEIVYVEPVPGTKTAIVVDPVIKHFVGNPVEAQISTDNSSRTTFVWKYKAANRGQTAWMDYRLTVQKAGLKASITGQARGFIGPYQADGTCARKRG